MKHTWILEHDGLRKTYVFRNFREALAFVMEVGRLAEMAQHHPDINIRWNKVHLLLVTHDAGHKVTEKDNQLAEQIDALDLESLIQQADDFLAA